MKKIYIINPHIGERFYINPFRLQVIQTELRDALCMDDVEVSIIDLNAKDNRINNDKDVSITLINTPENAAKEIINFLPMLNCKTIFLIGDIVEFGLIEEFCTVLKIGNKDKDIVPLYDNIANRIIYQMGDVLNNRDYTSSAVKQNIDNKVICFQNDIIESCEERGIQVFFDGVASGCKQQCSFCKLNNIVSSKGMRTHSEIDIAASIKQLSKKYKKKLFVQFTDENFFQGNENEFEQINLFIDKIEKCELNCYFGVDTRVDTIINLNDTSKLRRIREKTLHRFFQNGLRYCFIGVETVSEPQMRRYNKNLDSDCIMPAIHFLEQAGIVYTLGLILWDPMMSLDELVCNLDFLCDNNLIGKTASMLKPVRIQSRSKYLASHPEIVDGELMSDDFFNINRNSILYKDINIRKIRDIVDTIYDCFNEAGYRHSDVALFSVFYNEDTPDIIKNIPYLVSSLEYQILKLLISNVDNINEVRYEIYNKCKETVQRIAQGIYDVVHAEFYIDRNIDSIITYYQRTFRNVERNIEIALFL